MAGDAPDVHISFPVLKMEMLGGAAAPFSVLELCGCVVVWTG